MANVTAKEYEYDVMAETLRATGYDPELIERRRPCPIEVTNAGDIELTFGVEADLEDVLAELMAEYQEEHYEGLDLAVWRNGYLAAVVRQGRDGEPELTRFDHSWEGVGASN